MPENNDHSDGPIETPALDWLDGSIPVATRFDDPYYSKSDGLAETRHVFLNGNNLETRWQSLAPESGFTIAELGFGTGLNFLATVQTWRNTAPADARLRFISFEKYPMTPVDMKTALSRWPELVDDANLFCNKYRAAMQGEPDIISIEWAPGISLVLHLGDANNELAKTGFMADAWFLDGFAPSKNPQLWSADLLQAVFEHTAPGGSLATYTAAGWVRRNLMATGFKIARVRGHAGKREMMIGSRPV
jgi:tRNA U34 5-methylaminomethyl-2-thiouridine-forming methyltransferase MnmC